MRGDSLFEKLAARLGMSVAEVRGRMIAQRPPEPPPPPRVEPQKPMTAGQLLEALLALPIEALDLPVTTQGCDCDGEVGEVTNDGTQIYLSRP